MDEGFDTVNWVHNMVANIRRLGGLGIVHLFYDEKTIARHFRRQGAQIGEDCSILVHSLGDEPYLVKIGDHVTIAGGVVFATHDGAAWVGRREVADLQVFGPIVIEDNCVVGHGAILFPNVRIGRDSIVGAGSTVISDVPPETIVMGVPARPIGSVGKYRRKAIERWKEQRPPDAVIEPGEDWWHSRHYTKNRSRLRRHLTALFGNGSRPEQDDQRTREESVK